MRRDATTGLFVVEQILPQVQTRYALSIRGGVIATSGSQTRTCLLADYWWCMLNFEAKGFANIVTFRIAIKRAVAIYEYSSAQGQWNQVATFNNL